MMKQRSDYPAYENYYHFVGATKYRKNLFREELIRDRLKDIIKDIIHRKDGVEMVECTVA